MDNIMRFSPLGGDWEIKEKIGAGSYGSVYRAEKRSMNSVYECAVKHIPVPPEDVDAYQLISSGVAKDEYSVSVYYKDLMTYFKNEIDICHQLRGNTNIVSYEDHYIIPRSNGMGYDIFIRMELLRNLVQYKGGTAWTEQEVIDLGIDICSALEILRKHNIIHRDIKPSNIFVSRDGKYKLGDFGEAKILSGMKNAMTIRGSYPYMSPEIYRGTSGADIRADIYSLGMVMYRFLNNNRGPFVNPLAQTVSSDEIALSNQRRFGGEELNTPCMCRNQYLLYAIMRAVRSRPEERWQTPEEFKNYLLGVKAGNNSGANVNTAAPIYYQQNNTNNNSVNGQFNSTYNYHNSYSMGDSDYQATIPATNIPTGGRQMPQQAYTPPVVNGGQPQQAYTPPLVTNGGQPQPPKEKSNKLLVIVIILGVVLLVLLGVILVVVLGGKSSGGKTSDENEKSNSGSPELSSYQYSESETVSRYEESAKEISYVYYSEDESSDDEYVSKTEESSTYYESSVEESKPIKVRVDSYKDMSYYNAKQRIERLGLRANAEYVYSNDVVAGYVIDQSVRANSEVEENSYITLTVSMGPNFEDVIKKCSYCKQVVDVKASGSSATMTVYNLTDEGWVSEFSCRATVGTNGIGGKGLYGEGKKYTPKGIYRIGVVLSESDPGNMEWHKTTPDTVIVDDVNSPYYNQIKNESSLPSGTSCDHIGKRLNDGTENYSIFIEHNGSGYSSSGVVNGDGSSITICGRYKPIAPTFGCIDISSTDMINLLRALDRNKSPYIRTEG